MLCKDIVSNRSGIYKITNLIDGKFYIGRSSNLKSRKSKHKTKISNTIISRAIQKYGHDNFIFEVLEYCDIEYLISKEQYYLDLLIPFGNNGYNILKDSRNGGWFGSTHSDVTKRKMSDKKRGCIPWNKNDVQKCNIETRKLMSKNRIGEGNPFYGKSHSVESKNKISTKATGRDHSYEYKPVLQLDKITKEVIKEWDSISQAYLFFNAAPNSSNISKVCYGKQKSAFGFIWLFKN